MTREEFKNLTGDEKKEAKAELWDLIKKSLEKDAEATDALKVLRPSLFGSVGGGGGKPAKYITFADQFESIGDTVNEFDLYKLMFVGRKEVQSLIKDCIRKPSVEDRKWISFDPETGVYTLVGTGANAPKNWGGYLPTEDVDDELL